MIQRSKFEKFYSPVLILMTAYFISDLVLLQIRVKILPGSLPPVNSTQHFGTSLASRSQYGTIVSRNIFSFDPKILPALSELKNPGQNEQVNEQAVPSSLPLNLLGTIVHSIPEKSLAQIEIKSKSTTIAVRENQSIDRLALITKIERGRVTLRNLNNNRLEFLEMKSETKISFAAAKSQSTGGTGNDEVHETSPNNFEISRADLMKYTSSLTDILQQASSQPRIKPNGEIDGYTITSVQTNSIFSKLGIRPGDVIKSVNGEPVDGPGKAVELYNSLRNAGDVKITVERDGQDTERNYNIK